MIHSPHLISIQLFRIPPALTNHQHAEPRTDWGYPATERCDNWLRVAASVALGVRAGFCPDQRDHSPVRVINRGRDSD